MIHLGWVRDPGGVVVGRGRDGERVSLVPCTCTSGNQIENDVRNAAAGTRRWPRRPNGNAYAGRRVGRRVGASSHGRADPEALRTTVWTSENARRFAANSGGRGPVTRQDPPLNHWKYRINYSNRGTRRSLCHAPASSVDCLNFSAFCAQFRAQMRRRELRVGRRHVHPCDRK